MTLSSARAEPLNDLPSLHQKKSKSLPALDLIVAPMLCYVSALDFQAQLDEEDDDCSRRAYRWSCGVALKFKTSRFVRVDATVPGAMLSLTLSTFSLRFQRLSFDLSPSEKQ
jgi:hypothetical protein